MLSGSVDFASPPGNPSPRAQMTYIGLKVLSIWVLWGLSIWVRGYLDPLGMKAMVHNAAQEAIITRLTACERLPELIHKLEEVL